MRFLLAVLLSTYFGAGVFAASLFGSAIPSLNPLGYAWVALHWPKMVYCAPVERGCDPLPPQWLYRFMFDGSEIREKVE